VDHARTMRICGERDLLRTIRVNRVEALATTLEQDADQID
jgi:hypothetical protein